MRTIAVIGAAFIGATLLSFPSVAQQKTAKACTEEWRANKAANEAKGVTLKSYVTQCRAGGAAQTQTAPAAPAQKTTTAAAPAPTGQKTVKACTEEWRANKAANEAKGVTLKGFVADCRAGKATTAQPTLLPTQQQQTRTTTAPPPAAQPPQQAPKATTGAAPPAATAPTGANQYATEGQAKFRCLNGTVVWANLDSKIYHFSGNKTYGQTKAGAYMCERDAQGQGMRAAKNEKHP
ncbi:MAG TPA: hypothetical protein VL198_22115 [Pseudolabrys sp.]|jgi:hypothetical protein|nr:hypothetical protein [Pseudolabrys sp.]